MEKRSPRYKFQGFIYNPVVPDQVAMGDAQQDTFIDLVPSGNIDNLTGGAFPEYTVEYETVTDEVEITRARTVEYDGVLNQTKSASLLTYPTNVEAPFVLLTVGKYTFGTYSEKRNGSSLKIDYPNFIQGLRVTKINGQLNQYEVDLVYQIQKGNDPNIVDKIFGSVGYGTVRFSYGD